MTTTWPNTTIGNTSATTTSYHGNNAESARIASLHAKYITISVSGIFSNVILVLLIFLSKTLRTTPLFWNILNLCVYDSVTVMFVIPFGLDYELDWSWSYDEWTCKMWYAADFWHMLMAGTVIFCICIDRIVAVLQTFISIKVKLLRFISIFLVTLPWVFLVAVCIPLLVVFEHPESKLPSTMCFFQFHDRHMMTVAFISLALPNILLIIACNLMLFVYVLRGGNWNKISSNREDTEEIRLKMSITAVWVVVAVSLLCWLPVTFLAFFSVLFRSKCKGFTWDDFTDVYLLQVMTSSITPFLWIILPEVRHELAVWRRFISGVLRFRNKPNDSLVPSYQTETDDNETEIQDNTI
ncbi:octopamine receptor beta-2R-like [Pecten maximus]|uniref:octopamine receptor beta-2R-like n=1 Tax=Pecten maximus TaxID=6579 RepID=UPI001458969B|nr:octopamine receptor beta-2R-like [Pecten maximus]